MFLRQIRRTKDGKTHSYWSVVENQRFQGGRVVQRHVLYLGEISPSQAAAWRKSIEVFDEEAGHPRRCADPPTPWRRNRWAALRSCGDGRARTTERTTRPRRRAPRGAATGSTVKGPATQMRDLSS
jgi:hypothetical protein